MKLYSDYLAEIFPNFKVQKISIDAGFTCPNRDGAISYGGCIYCRNDSFSPSYCRPEDPISLQLERGKKFFSRKYPEMKYLAYFQSYTGTYNKSLTQLERLYKEALDVEDVVGLIVATRPDSISSAVFKLLAEFNKNKPVFIEFGAETANDSTLKLINRNHTWNHVRESVNRAAEHNLHCGLHLIAGLPYESKEIILDTVRKACDLPIETIKFHQLQVLKDTTLAQMISKNEIAIPHYSLQEYLDLCLEIIKLVPSHIAIERFLSQSPPDMVIEPSWKIKNHEFMNKIKTLL